MRSRRAFSDEKSIEPNRSLKIPSNLETGFGSSLIRLGGDPCLWRMKLTTGLNALALVRFGGLRPIHSGGRDGFGLLLIALVAIGGAIWVVSRPERSDQAKS